MATKISKYEEYLYEVGVNKAKAVSSFVKLYNKGYSMKKIIWELHNTCNRSKDRPITYSEYVEICNILEYISFPQSTFIAKFNDSDFWSKHSKLSMRDIMHRGEDCFDFMDKRYIKSLPKIHSVTRPFG